ncbi:MAG: universal stress protein [Caldilineaceae bacterium]
MKTRILIPTDGSHFSEQIIAHIQRFFPTEGTELILFRVGEPIYSSIAAQAELAREAMTFGDTMRHIGEREIEAAYHPIYATQIEVNQRAELETTLQPLANGLREAGFTVSTLVEFGDPARMIIHAIERDKIDVLAMTTHGRTGLGRAIFGSVAESVMRQVRIPILLFRPE